MDTLKILFTFILLLSFTGINYAQSAKTLELADNRVSEINKLITSVNPDAALTLEQKKQIKDLHIKRTEKIQEIKQSDLSETEKEAKIINLRKDFGRTYTRDILSQEQRKAKKEAKLLTSSNQ